jgi:predicted RND superfamily exporter protein
VQALFYIDLYDLNKKYFDENTLNVTIDLFDIDKLELLEWLKNYKNVELYFLDNNSLLSIAKYDQAVLLTSSLLFALVIIGSIIAWIFRSYSMAFVAFTINVIPIIWFGLFVTLFNIPMSLEMLIAMTISLGLASDATIHFTYKYYRLRYFGRSLKHTLEKVFFYAAIPVIIGSVVLVSVFASLYFSQIASLQLIGLYSAILITISLITDLFILPVMLLFVDKFEKIEKAH